MTATTTDELAPVEKSQTSQDPPPTLVEWTARAISLGLIGLLVAFVVIEGIRADAPPTFDVTIDHRAISTRDDRWVVPVSVVNTGDTAVAQLVITLEVVIDNSHIREDLTIPLLGHGAHAEGEFWIDRDPRDAQMRAHVAGYQVP